METSKQRVLAAINHIQPDTTPVHIMGFEGIERWLELFGAEDDFELRIKMGLDLQTARPIYSGPNIERGVTIWGTEPNVSGYAGFGYSQAGKSYPLAGAGSVVDIERFAWPDPDDFDYEIVARTLKAAPGKACVIRPQYTVQQDGYTREDAARGGGLVPSIRASGAWMPILCGLFELFGLEETLIKFHAEPKIIEATITHVEAFILEFSRRQLEATRGMADIFWYGDDFATQRGILISPEHWRRFLKPTYKKVFELAKSYGVKMWFHGCGTFRPVLPDLIDIGMDVWETVQVHLPGNEPEVLKREYGQDITFYGAVNSQYTLPFGTPEEVRKEVRERIRVLGKGGGYICGADHTILPDVPVDNVLALLEEARKSSP
ncbi:MAG: uroporphyrinogen decarboxylase family protein [Dehalococcoidales bacterium]